MTSHEQVESHLFSPNSIEHLPEQHFFGIYVPGSDPQLWITEDEIVKSQIGRLALCN